MKNAIHVYAIMCYDSFMNSIEERIRVTKIVRTYERAVSEVDRLNTVNAGAKGVENGEGI